ncbi:MAG TPA: hypothetical protein VIV40_01595 [Kofleriaceae bacterium]
MFARAITAEPTHVFERPSSMYPLASFDRDETTDSTPTFASGTESEASQWHEDTDDDAVPLAVPRAEPRSEFDPASVIRRFDDVPTLNDRTRVVSKPRIVKGTVPPPVSASRDRRQEAVDLLDSYAAAMRKFR